MQCFYGPVSFMDCPNPMEWIGGGSDDAGFVQIMEGHTTDSDRLHSVRPEIIGGTFASNGDGDYVEAVHFTNGSEVREHEKDTVPFDLCRPVHFHQLLMDEDSLRASESHVLQLRDSTAGIFHGTITVARWDIAVLHRDHRWHRGASVQVT